MPSSFVFEKGLVPLENETAQDYTKRLERGAIPHASQNFAAAIKARALTQKLFGFNAAWIPLRFSNKNLTFLEAGAAFLQGENLGFIQLRKSFQKRQKLFFCPLDELIAHEMVHIVRSQVPGQRFDEILAYKTSKSAWRRLLGPLFDTSWESIVFLMTLIVAQFSAFLETPSLWLPFFGYGLFLGCRLYQRRRLLNITASKLKDERLLLYLSDQEIQNIAKSSDYLAYLQEVAPNSLRLQYILEH